MQVVFSAGHTPIAARLTNTPANCNTGSNLRCDDPKDLSGSGGLVAPTVQSTYVLNDLNVQVRASGTAGWNTLKDYQLGYEQNGPSQITDASTGKSESVAGYLDLTTITPTGDDNLTALPTRTFTYTNPSTNPNTIEYYEDDTYHPNPATNCGPSWNTGNGSGCILWSQSEDGNGHYLATASNGLGLAQTFSWANARNNTHGVNSGGSKADPLYCDSHPTGYPCNEADDQAWSHVVLTQQSGGVVRATSGGNVNVTSTTAYTYYLTTNFAGKECGDCTQGMYWGNENENDYLDYYNGKYMGFAETDVSNPDHSLTAHKYDATEGWGVYDNTQITNCAPNMQPTGPTPCPNVPWWDLTNAAHGHEYETDSYDTNGTTLLKKSTTQYQAVCPPAGVGATPPVTGYGNFKSHLVSELDLSNPVAVCDVQATRTDDYTYDGSSASGVPDATTTSVFDSFGRVTSTTTSGNDGHNADHYEAESQTFGAHTAPMVIASNCCGVAYSNNADLWIQSTAAGQYATESFTVPTTGTYDLSVVMIQAHDNGISTLAIDGKTVGQPFDGYHNPLIIAAPLDDGLITLSAGTHQATWTATGKNASSINYYVSVDYFDLTLAGGPASITHTTVYIQNNAISASQTGATGTYLIDYPGFSDTEDSHGNRYACAYTSYDGHGYALGQQSGLTLGEVTTSDKYTNCGSPANGWAPSGVIRTTSTYDTYGNLLTTDDPDANAGNGAHLGCTVGSTQYSTCSAYDTTFGTLPTTTTNALNQTTSNGYAAPATATNVQGYGLWPISTTDKNGQTTTYGYDGLGRMTSQTLPGESTGLTSANWTYTDWCSGTSAQTPCLEVDQTQRLNSSTTVISRAFYDGWGNLIETRGQAPNGQDIVRYRYYDASGRVVFDSITYFVAAYTGGPGSAAFSVPDTTQTGTKTADTGWYGYDGLGRVTRLSDPLSNTTTTGYTVVCSAAGTEDSACYEQTLVADPLGHESGGLIDALGRKLYNQRYTGNSPNTYAVYATTMYSYDYNRNLTRILQPDGTTATSFAYDAAGHKTSMTDPDSGLTSFAYDADGNVTQSVDPRGSAGTVYVGYDSLDRAIWRNTTNSPTGAYEAFTYDSTANGNVGVGRLTSETFAGGPNQSLSGSYAYTYDSRGQQTSSTLKVGSTNYPEQSGFDDAGNVISQTYPSGEVVTTSYTAQGWLAGLSTQQGSTATTLLSNASYSGFGGAAKLMTGAALDTSTYQYSATYDQLLRPTDIKVARVSDGATLFEQTRGFDGAGNVANVSTTLPTGTDSQAFCYDEQDRLTWASSASGTIPCGGSNTAGTLSGAQYTQSFGYDTLGRLTTGPLGTYSYGPGMQAPTNPAPVHAALAIGSSYTAAYDAAGNMTCRAPSSGTTCTGTPTGAELSYDAEGMLSSWQNAPSNPSTTDTFLYDGQGNRVEQQVSSGGTTTTTVYIGNIEEVQTSGSTTTTTTYYYAGSTRIAEAVNGVFSYLASDGLNSATLALGASGNGQASVLYAPYGTVRYSQGTMPTDYGFTGQHTDSTTGLDYYVARFYDPLAGQFTSPDSTLPGDGYDVWGLSRYAYVEGNPTTRTDPSGHCPWCIGFVVGALVGAAIEYGTQVYSNYQSGNPNPWTDVNLVQIGEAALVGGVIGATGGLAGAAVASALEGSGAVVAIGGATVAGAVLGAGEGAAGQVGDNLIHGRHWSDDVGQAAIFGAVTGGAGGGAGAALGRYGGRILRAGARLLGGVDDGDVGAPLDANDDPAARRVTLRQSTKRAIQAAAPRTPDGDFIDPNTGATIPKEGPFDYGHKPGVEWWRTQQQARLEGWTRQDVIEFENTPDHYQIEDPTANRGHRFEMP